MTDLTWWGYLHQEGNVQVKRFFDYKDIDEAIESDFVLKVFGPFRATGREHAIEIVKTRIKEEVKIYHELSNRNSEIRKRLEANNA